MKNSKIALAALTVLVLVTGCASTAPTDDKPIANESFQFNDNSSFAKNMMYLAGSNKFVDSKNGIENTRTVTGGTASTILSLARFDLFGAATNSLTNSAIENEPLSRGTSFFITLPINSLKLTPTEQEEVRTRGLIRFKELLTKSGVVLKGVFSNKKNYQEVYVSNNYCENRVSDYLVNSKGCQMFLEKGKILRITTSNNQYFAVVKYRTRFSNILFNAPKYLNDNEYMYISAKNGRKIVSLMPASIVINKNKVHYFKRGAKESDGKDIRDITMNWYVDSSLAKGGKDLFFKVDMDTLKFIPMK